jgi:hypothetical protein
MSDTEYGPSFIRTYSNLVADVWRSDEEEARLTADPTAYAIEKGLPVAEGATVVLDRTQPEGLYHRDTIVEDWTKQAGVHVLHVPAIPLVDLDELSDAELDAVSAGLASADNNNNVFVIVV